MYLFTSSFSTITTRLQLVRRFAVIPSQSGLEYRPRFVFDSGTRWGRIGYPRLIDIANKYNFISLTYLINNSELGTFVTFTKRWRVCTNAITSKPIVDDI